jgi:hypothetical protein
VEARAGALSAIGALPARFKLANPDDESLRRAALADWLADSKNPLTWRSIANRLWHYHFGRGLCDTPSDFGRMGGVPSHPELLDWLACELRDNGGSLKHLHRLILTSATYRQSSDFRETPAKLDGENRLLWRQNRQRLDADCFKDSVLAVSGSLNLTMGGPSDHQFMSSEGIQGTPKVDYGAFDWTKHATQRRSIYRFTFRGMPDPFMEALDFPDLSLLAPVRAFSASPLQSLALYNNPFVLQSCRELAQRTQAAGSDVSSQVSSVMKRLLLRAPEAGEAEVLIRYARVHGLAALCRVLINSNEFLFIN